MRHARLLKPRLSGCRGVVEDQADLTVPAAVEATSLK